MQKLWTTMTARSDPVRKYRKVAYQPKTVVYPNWTAERSRAANAEVSGWVRRNS